MSGVLSVITCGVSSLFAGDVALDDDGLDERHGIFHEEVPEGKSILLFAIEIDLCIEVLPP